MYEGWNLPCLIAGKHFFGTLKLILELQLVILPDGQLISSIWTDLLVFWQIYNQLTKPGEYFQIIHQILMHNCWSSSLQSLCSGYKVLTWKYCFFMCRKILLLCSMFSLSFSDACFYHALKTLLICVLLESLTTASCRYGLSYLSDL